MTSKRQCIFCEKIFVDCIDLCNDCFKMVEYAMRPDPHYENLLETYKNYNFMRSQLTIQRTNGQKRFVYFFGKEANFYEKDKTVALPLQYFEEQIKTKKKEDTSIVCEEDAPPKTDGEVITVPPEFQEIPLNLPPISYPVPPEQSSKKIKSVKFNVPEEMFEPRREKNKKEECCIVN